jgi:hypothetical protein
MVALFSPLDQSHTQAQAEDVKGSKPLISVLGGLQIHTERKCIGWWDVPFL